jgi:hypothetical protein
MSEDKELTEKLKAMMCGDPEMDHGNADNFISDVLREKGLVELAEAYDELSEEFWCA